VPLCSRGDLDDLRIAAALLASRRSDPAGSDEPRRLYDAIAGSLASRLLVVNRAGVIVAANAAWTGFARRYQVPEGAATVIGLDCTAVLRGAVGARESDADSMIAGVEAVLSGQSDAFSTSYMSDLPGENRWWIVTVTPMGHPRGGAVIEHTPVGQTAVDALAQRTGTRIFERLVDTAPVPIWVAALDGVLLYGNAAWAQPAADGAQPPAKWTDAIHPEDRRRAAAMFRRAYRRRRGFDAEFRVRCSDGSYRWWRCTAAPHYTAAGEVEWYIGVCSDATSQQHWKSAFEHVAGKLVAAQEEERIHIARELHDDLGQQAAVLGSKLDMFQARRARTTVEARRTQQATVRQIRSAVDQIAATIHSLSHRLHPAKLRLLGLVPTIEALCRDESAASGVEVRFTANDVPEKLPDATELCLFRVAQEGVRNALRHSGATTVDVALSSTGTRLTLTVADNGSGFDPASASHGLGLFTMRERVQLVGGDLTLTSSRDKGTTITIVVPVPDSDQHR
jgi:PAS domain S-box-containing protein